MLVSRCLALKYTHSLRDFDLSFCLKKDLEKVISKKIRIKMLAESKCLFDVITRSCICLERRLLINIAVLKKGYDRNKISQVRHVLRENNPGDWFTIS